MLKAEAARKFCYMIIKRTDRLKRNKMETLCGGVR